MELTIDQPVSDKTDYLAEVVRFIGSQKMTQEQLESRFDALMTEYARGYKYCFYIAKDRRLIIGM